MSDARHLAARRIFPKLILWMALLAGSTGAWAAADLVLNHSDSPDPGPAGGIFSYTLRVDNNGPDAAVGVTLSDTLPAGAQFISAVPSTGSCPTVPAVGAGGSVSCVLGNLPFTTPSSAASVVIRVRLPAAGVWTNVATAGSATADQNSANNTAIANQTTVVAASDLSITVTAQPTAVVAGAGFSFLVNTSNLGPNPLPADAIQSISFAVPAGMGIASAPTGTGWTCPTNSYPRLSGSIVCQRSGPLAVGASAPQLTVPAVLNQLGSGTLAVATAATLVDNSSSPDGNLANNSASASATASAGSDLAITKEAVTPFVALGGNAVFTLTARHRGGQPPGGSGSRLVTVTDTLGPNLSFVSASGAGWTCGAAGQVVTCTLPGPYTGGNHTDLPVITLTARANAGGILGNQVAVNAPEPDPNPGNNTSAANVTVNSATDLRMLKRASFSVLVPNQGFVYVLSAFNVGPLPVATGQNLRIVDTLPANVELTSAPAGEAGSSWVCSSAPAAPYPRAGAVVTCDLPGPLAVGATTPVINLNVRMPAAGPATNNACVSLSGVGPSDTAPANNCIGVPVNTSATRADLRLLSKTAAPATVASGQPLTYVITVRNEGPDSASNVTVTDTLASLLVAGGLQSATPSQGSCSPAGPASGPSVTVSCNLGTMAAGELKTVTIVARPVVAVSGARVNMAQVSSPDIGDPDPDNNILIVSSNVTALADLSVAMVANPASIQAGAPLTYVLTVGNAGASSAQTPSLSNSLPANAAFLGLVSVSGGGTCATQPAAGTLGGTLGCSWPSIAAGSQQTVSYRVRPLGSAAGAVLNNAVTVDTATAESSVANNSAVIVTPVTAPLLDIVINKVDSVDPVDLGGATTYTVRIENTGPSSGTNVVLTDVFPAPGVAAAAQFSYQGALTVDNGGVCTQPALGATAGTLRCTFPALDAGGVARVTYAMRAETLAVAGATVGTAYNRASVAVNEAEGTLANNTVIEGTTTRRNLVATDLSVTKSVNLVSAAPGAPLVYTLRATNNGPVGSDGAQLNDLLPAGTTLVSAPGCVASGNSLGCPVGPLAVGAARAFIVTVRIDLPYAGPAALVNTVTVDAPGDTNPGNNSASASTQVVGTTPPADGTPLADLSVTVVASATTVPAGGSLGYVITIGNAGPASALAPILNNSLPGNAAFLGGLSVSGGGTCSTLPAVGALGGMLGCSWPAMAAGSQQTVRYQVRPPLGTPAGAVLNNAMTVATTTPESTLANNSAAAATPVTAPQMDIVISKADSVDPVSLGGTTTYTVSIENTGPSGATNLVLTDVFPAPGMTANAQFSYRGALNVDNGGVCTEPPLGATVGTLRCTFPALATGAVARVSYVMRAETLTVAGASIGTGYNRANVTINEAESTLANNSVTEATSIRGAPVATDLSIAKSVDLATAAPGSQLVYTLVVTNNGPMGSVDAQLTDLLPAGSTLVSAPGCVAADNSLRCLVGPLAVGASQAFTVTVRIDLPYVGPATLVNTASVEAASDTDPGNNSASASTQVVEVAVVGGEGGGVEPVPTLSGWALMLLAGIMGWMGLRQRERR